jgi:hypothetical protein
VTLNFPQYDKQTQNSLLMFQRTILLAQVPHLSLWRVNDHQLLGSKLIALSSVLLQLSAQ